mmetsp:Transcript_12595/g.25565  ORF Transcript_12595/g.25565 Transcript_12595/m.25565 type:complete len:82 (-) Transcript_12595:884-1129(-)
MPSAISAGIRIQPYLFYYRFHRRFRSQPVFLATLTSSRVIWGMDTVEAIAQVPVDKHHRPQKDVIIESVTIHANPIADAAK